MSKTVTDGIFGNFGESPEVLDIVGGLLGVAPGVEDLVAEAVEGEVAGQPVPLGHDKVPDRPGLRLGEGLAPVVRVQAGDGRGRPRVENVYL